MLARWAKLSSLDAGLFVYGDEGGSRNLRAERLVFEHAAATYDHGGRFVDLVPNARQVRERLGRD